MMVAKTMYEKLAELLPDKKMRPWHELGAHERMMWQQITRIPWVAAIEAVETACALKKSIGVP
jgi:hypothetical protein